MKTIFAAGLLLICVAPTATPQVAECSDACTEGAHKSAATCEPTSAVCGPASSACGVATSVCGPGQSCGTLATFGVDPARRVVAPQTAATTLPFRNLASLIEPVRASYRVPALAVAVSRTDGVVAAGATGARIAGHPQSVTPFDRFHLGSCGKAFTATVAARLVAANQIRWETTVADAFPELVADNNPYRDVTLQQLLAHRSGLPTRSNAMMHEALGYTGDAIAQRVAFVRMALSLPPASEPGTTFGYTDVGYTVAGAMLERAAGTSWEELVREHVQAPLGLTSLGFGEPATFGGTDQPWGHIAEGDRMVPFTPGPSANDDNPPVIGPAGLVHLSVVDWARFAAAHLSGARGESPDSFLSADAFGVLHADSYSQGYSLGWGVQTTDRGRGLSHTGSCGEWYSLIWILPDADLAIVVATNIGGGNAVAAANEALQVVLTEIEQAPSARAAADH